MLRMPLAVHFSRGVGLALMFLACLVAPLPVGARPPEISAVEVNGSHGKLRIFFVASAPVDYHLQNSDRMSLVLDVYPAVLGRSGGHVPGVPNDLVRSASVRAVASNRVRVTLQFTQPLRYEISTTGEGLALVFVQREALPVAHTVAVTRAASRPVAVAKPVVTDAKPTARPVAVVQRSLRPVVAVAKRAGLPSPEVAVARPSPRPVVAVVKPSPKPAIAATRPPSRPVVAVKPTPRPVAVVKPTPRPVAAAPSTVPPVAVAKPSPRPVAAAARPTATPSTVAIRTEASTPRRIPVPVPTVAAVPSPLPRIALRSGPRPDTYAPRPAAVAAHTYTNLDLPPAAHPASPLPTPAAPPSSAPAWARAPKQPQPGPTASTAVPHRRVAPAPDHPSTLVAQIVTGTASNVLEVAARRAAEQKQQALLTAALGDSAEPQETGAVTRLRDVALLADVAPRAIPQRLLNDPFCLPLTCGRTASDAGRELALRRALLGARPGKEGARNVARVRSAPARWTVARARNTRGMVRTAAAVGTGMQRVPTADGASLVAAVLFTATRVAWKQGWLLVWNARRPVVLEMLRKSPAGVTGTKKPVDKVG